MKQLTPVTVRSWLVKSFQTIITSPSAIYVLKLRTDCFKVDSAFFAPTNNISVKMTPSETHGSTVLCQCSNQRYYWVPELNILSDLVLQTKWKTEKKWNNRHLVNVIRNWKKMSSMYELNKKQKKGETIDTCHSAFLARKNLIKPRITSPSAIYVALLISQDVY